MNKPRDRTAYMAEYYRTHREEAIAYAIAHRRAPDAEREYQKQYRAKNLLKRREQAQDYTRKHPARRMWKAAHDRAKLKRLEFDLTPEWVQEKLDQGICEFSGMNFNHKPKGMPKGGHPYAPSIDRKDCRKGYTQDNCRVILWAFNIGFAQWGEQQTIALWRDFFSRVPPDGSEGT